MCMVTLIAINKSRTLIIMLEVKNMAEYPIVIHKSVIDIFFSLNGIPLPSI